MTAVVAVVVIVERIIVVVLVIVDDVVAFVCATKACSVELLRSERHSATTSLHRRICFVVVLGVLQPRLQCSFSCNHMLVCREVSSGALFQHKFATVIAINFMTFVLGTMMLKFLSLAN